MARFSPDPHSRFRWVFWGFMAIGAFFVLTEHTAHVLGILPYLLVLACPLMHLFMHHGQGHGHHAHRHVADEAGPDRHEEKRP